MKILDKTKNFQSSLGLSTSDIEDQQVTTSQAIQSINASVEEHMKRMIGISTQESLINALTVEEQMKKLRLERTMETIAMGNHTHDSIAYGLICDEGATPLSTSSILIMEGKEYMFVKIGTTLSSISVNGQFLTDTQINSLLTDLIVWETTAKITANGLHHKRIIEEWLREKTMEKINQSSSHIQTSGISRYLNGKSQFSAYLYSMESQKQQSIELQSQTTGITPSMIIYDDIEFKNIEFDINQ